jgi:hypothetical protein
MNKKHIAMLGTATVILVSCASSEIKQDDIFVAIPANIALETSSGIMNHMISSAQEEPIAQQTVYESKALALSGATYQEALQVNIPEDTRKSQPLSNNELLQVLKEAGFSGNGLRMAWAIVIKESTSNPDAHNQNRSTGDNSYGLFQINMIDGLGPARLKKHSLNSNEDLFDPRENARVAFTISDGGTSWKAWTTYKDAKNLAKQFPG